MGPPTGRLYSTPPFSYIMILVNECYLYVVLVLYLKITYSIIVETPEDNDVVLTRIGLTYEVFCEYHRTSSGFTSLTLVDLPEDLPTVLFHPLSYNI